MRGGDDLRAVYCKRTLPCSALNWFDLHFRESSFRGRLFIGRRSNESVLRLYVADREGVRSFLDEMYVSQNVDYYITANMVSGIERRLDGLFALCNIVIDVDCHDGCEVDVEPFLWRLRHDEVFPSPNSVVKTGRGVQLWWALEPLHAKCAPYYAEARDCLLRVLGGFLSEYREEFGRFSADSSSSRNLVGYYRLPGTFNTKAGAMAEAEIWRDEPYVLQELVRWAKGVKSEHPAAAPSVPEPESDAFAGRYQASDVRLLRSIHTLAFFRMRQLVRLRLLRDREIGQETRNNLCFIAYNTLLPAMGHEKSFEKLKEFNAGFREPMTEKQLEGVICSARDKGGYRYSNRKLIEFLGLTAWEQEQIGLWEPATPYSPVTHVSAHPGRRAAARLAKEDRDKKILALAKQGLKQPAIASELGITRQTVAAVLRREGFDRRQEVLSLFDSGKTVPEISELCGLCPSTIQKIRKSKNVKNPSYI